MALRTITAGLIAMAGCRRARRSINPIGGSQDDVCPPPFSQTTCLANLQTAKDIPIPDVLAFPPQQITGPLAIDGADSSFTGIDFVPDAFVTDPVQPGAVLYSLEGDFGFSPSNATPPAPEIGHEVKLINFNQLPGSPLALRIQNFARNPPGMEQAFIFPNLNGFNRPTQHQVRPGWVRLCRRLRRCARPRLRLTLRGPTRQRSAGPDPRYRSDLEDLPNVARRPVAKGRLRPPPFFGIYFLFCLASAAGRQRRVLEIGLG